MYRLYAWQWNSLHGALLTTRNVNKGVGMNHLIACFALVIGTSVATVAQIRVVVLPFRNMDGEIALNAWSYELADSLKKKILETDPTQTVFVMVAQDSVEMAISNLNLDPSNVQYESDVWRAMEDLHVDRVVQGNFFRRGPRVLMNAYVYDVEFKMADPEFQAKDIYKSETTYMSAVPTMAKKLYPALLKPLP